VSLLILSPIQLSHCETQSSMIQSWQVENSSGYSSESNGVIHLWSNGGSVCPSIHLYKQIKPTTDFSFSVQVNAQTMESCSIDVRGTLPVAGSMDGFNFEFGYYGDGIFALARNTSDSVFNQFPFGNSSSWTSTQFAYGNPNVWYTMQLNVSSSPFVITASVLNENGTSIGTYSTSDIAGFTFGDINYIGFGVWGYSPSDYLFRNIQDSFDKPSYITISTDCSSATAGSAVNVYGTLLDSNSTPLQNKIVVLSHTFLGANTWIPISSALTDEQGNYDIQWVNSASGTFTLKVEWGGDSTHMSASNTTTLSFLPYQKQTVFFVESNSTVYGLAFNNETSTLSFNVTGPSGTTGYVKATISKDLLTNGENLQVLMDGSQLNYSVTSEVDSWVVTFNYNHSTHQICINLEANVSTVKPWGNEVILIVIIAVLGTVLAAEIKSIFSHKEKDQRKQFQYKKAPSAQIN
jgi:hypothetical protein